MVTPVSSPTRSECGLNTILHCLEWYYKLVPRTCLSTVEVWYLVIQHITRTSGLCLRCSLKSSNVEL